MKEDDGGGDILLLYGPFCIQAIRNSLATVITNQLQKQLERLLYQ